MSVVIVKTSAIKYYQNRTTVIAATVADDQAVSRNHLSPFQATTSDFINTNTQSNQLNTNYNPQLQRDNLTITNHIIRTNIIVGGSGGSSDTGEGIYRQNSNKSSTENMRAKLQQLLQRENNNDDDEEKQQLQLDLNQQQLMQEQQQQQQQQQQYQSQHAIINGENAYLLERIDGGIAGAAGNSGSGVGGMHEQPIYGTWSAKARRPQAPLLTATATATSSTTTTAATILQPSASVKTILTEVDENFYGRQQPLNHHYERLPRRSSTMTPVRRELHDQIPRPPRLTSRQPSAAVRRQFSETSLPNGLFRDDTRPKPFHYPFEGPLPEEFKKLQPGERIVGSGLDHDSQVHNIQDILQKLHLGPVASKVPPLMMMPTGLHISGSFKNLKSSGIGNFFRTKRNKKQMQMQFPMTIPMHMMPNPYQATSVMNFMPQPYQQRIAMEQFYPFKPRSPGDINLLAAMQQQQQQQQQKFKNPQSKTKKQKKKQKDKKNILASSNLMMHQYPYATAAPDFLFPSMYPPLMSINVTQVPPLQMSKRVPFKLNLDIFPVIPPSKNFKSPAGYGMDEARIVSTMRSPTAFRNPFMDYLTTPATPTAAAALNLYNPFNSKQPIYNPIRFPTGASSNMHMAYPDQMQKYMRQQQQQQQQQQQNLFSNFLNSQGHQTPFLPIDCDPPIPSSAASSSQLLLDNTKTNPIMVHLNVFPKQKPSSLSPISTNPFYQNVPNIQRNTIQEESESSQSSIEPRHQGRSLNDTTHAKIARSDSNEDIQQIQPLQRVEDLVDFEHPIVAEGPYEADDRLPQPEALTGEKQNMASESASSSFYYESRPNTTTTLTKLLDSNNGDNSNTNYNGNVHENMEQMVSEARTASLFRFPVEDLIQFQVHDAM